jgi:hypothetical protein
VRSGQTQGLLFWRKNGSPTKMGYFNEPLIERLVWIQDNTHGLIPMTINLWWVVVCRRSMRQGATTAAYTETQSVSQCCRETTRRY